MDKQMMGGVLLSSQKQLLKSYQLLIFKPGVVNVNDWHTALSVIYLDVLKSREAEFMRYECAFDS